MRKLRLALIVLGLVVFAGQDAFAQLNRRKIKKNNKRIANFRGRKNTFDKGKSYSSIGFTVSALNYYGDIAPRPERISTDISFTRPALGLTFVRRFGPRYSVLGQVMYGTLKGDDNESAKIGDASSAIYRFKRNASFRNRIVEASAVAVIDLFKNESTYIGRAGWTPYFFLGFAVFTNNPEAQAPAKDLNGNALAEAGKWVKLRPLGTEGQYSTLNPTDVNFGIKPYKTLQAAIPFGVGTRFRINQVMDLWVDIGFRYTFTDYIDDISANYVDLGVLKSDLARAMSYRTGEIMPQLIAAGNTPILSTYIARDGKSYTVIAGYGEEYPDNNRGSKKDKDIYMVTSIKLTYILGATFHKAKFR